MHGTVYPPSFFQHCPAEYPQQYYTQPHYQSYHYSEQRFHLEDRQWCAQQVQWHHYTEQTLDLGNQQWCTQRLQSHQGHTAQYQEKIPKKLKTPCSEANVAVGSIVWLAPKNCEYSCQCVQYDCQYRPLEAAAYNHPAAILHMKDQRSKGGVIMTLCCSISANPRPNFFEKVRNLPISRLPRHLAPWENSTHRPGEIMYLEKQGSLYKQSYILTNHVYAIPLSQLEVCDDGNQPFQNRLCQESYINLMGQVRFIHEHWIPTATLEANYAEAVRKEPILGPLTDLPKF